MMHLHLRTTIIDLILGNAARWAARHPRLRSELRRVLIDKGGADILVSPPPAIERVEGPLLRSYRARLLDETMTALRNG